MWNLCLTDSLTGKGFRQNQFANNNNQGHSSQFQSTTPKPKESQSGNKPSYCWKFNRNGKCKFSANCKFINRCSYCDGQGHGLYNCPRKSEILQQTSQ